MNFLDAAKRYLAKGFSIIPLKPKDKRPLIPWKEFQTRKATEEEINQWFSSDENNIGIVTGTISGIDVVDCDSIDAIELARKMGIPKCLSVHTAKGRHFYFKHEPGASNFQKRDDLPGIDLRAEGGYVAAPPSIHPTGAVYRWDGESIDIPQLPAWVLAHKGEKKTSEEMYRGAGTGSRNDTLARLAGVWVRSLPLEEALEMASTWNQRNDPPMAEREVKQVIESIYRTDRKNHPEVRDKKPIEMFLKKPSDIHFALRNLYKNGYEKGTSTGWSSLDNLYTVRRGEWTLITGIPGHGKSTFLDNMVVNMMRGTDWKFGIFSAENYPHERYLAGLIEQVVGKPFSEGPSKRLSEKELDNAVGFLEERMTLMWPEDEQKTVDTVLELADKMISEKRIDGLVIDPWNELNHWPRPDGQTETEYILIQLSKIRKFARTHKIHVWIVAHPAKMLRGKDQKYPVPTAYDVSGSAHWRNQADNVICVWRDVSVELAQNEIHVQKIRFREVGQIGMANLSYDKITGRYFDPAGTVYRDKSFYEVDWSEREPGGDG